MSQGDITKAFCNTCAGERNHHIVYYYPRKWRKDIDPPVFIFGEDHYELLQCTGCDSVTLRHTSIHSDVRDEQAQIVPAISYYPRPSFRRLPTWIEHYFVTERKQPGGRIIKRIRLPEFVGRLLREIYAAVDAECLSLAAMGIRALLEMIMIKQVGDQGGFAKNLDALQKAGHISSTQKTTLKSTLEMGHGVIHRDFAPLREEVISALDIAETIAKTIYVDPRIAAALEKSVPPRRKTT